MKIDASHSFFHFDCFDEICNYRIFSYSFRSKNSVFQVKIEILRQLFELATISKKNSFRGNYTRKYGTRKIE